MKADEDGIERQDDDFLLQDQLSGTAHLYTHRTTFILRIRRLRPISVCLEVITVPNSCPDVFAAAACAMKR